MLNLWDNVANYVQFHHYELSLVFIVQTIWAK